MIRSALISRYLPSDEDMVHGIYQRLALLVEAMCRASAMVDCLFLVPRGSDVSPARLSEIEARLHNMWSPKVRLQVAPTLSYSTPRWPRFQRYVKAVFSIDSVEGVAPYLNDESKRAVSALFSTRPDFLVAHRLQPMALLASMPGELPQVPILFDMDDVEHLALARRLLKSPEWPLERLRLLQLPAAALCERRAVRAATRTFVCSETDRRYLQKLSSTSTVAVLPNCVAIPPAASSTHTEPNVLFVGTFGYPPNVAAASFLLREIWPAIRAQVPGARLTLVGKKPQSIPGYAPDLPDIEFAGFVPDLAPYYARSRVVCCPILSGSGTRIKILEAASYGKPVVSTTIGAEGIELEAGREFVRADTAAELTAACVRLLQDEAAAQRLGHAAREKIKSVYSRDSVAHKLCEWMLDCVGASPSLAALPGGGTS